MAIIRAERKDPYTHLYNETLRDKRLSFKARGLLAYMLSMADNWKFYTKSIIASSDKDGRDSVLSGLKELEKCGYLKRQSKRNESGKFDSQDWIIVDKPTIPPETDFPDTGKPDTDNPQLRTNKDKNYQRKKKTSRHKPKAYDPSSPYYKLAEYLKKLMLQNDPESRTAKKANMQVWSDDMRKLVELDGRSLHQVSVVIKWSQKNDFWSTNILSPGKLRDKFDMLNGIVKKEQGKKPKPTTPEPQGFDSQEVSYKRQQLICEYYEKYHDVEQVISEIESGFDLHLTRKEVEGYLDGAGEQRGVESSGLTVTGTDAQS